jgi:uncharacterized protein YrrD
MDISVDAKVRCTDGDAGHVSCVIINPVTDTITHLVVYDQEFLGVERIIPISLVVQSDPDKVLLDCRREDLHTCEPFIGLDYDFLKSETPYIHADAAYWPLVEPNDMETYEMALQMAEYEKVPPGELLVRRGAAVFAQDGKIGHVHEFVADPTTGHVTHLVLTRGHLWGKHDVIIPLSAIKIYGDERVTLKIDKRAVGELPRFALKH